ncbi:histidinol-phosphate transaminase [candidate division KSB1 bacterium]|nr:histidinol-phosphate transaminase [candidate division KSB1 bacterium]
MPDYFKSQVTDLPGYQSPPQSRVKAKLNQNESPFDVPEMLKEQILAQARQLEWHRYPEHSSSLLRTKLSEWLGYSPDSFVLGNGSNQLLQTLLNATISDGEKVLICPPTFSLFDLFPPLYGAELINVYNNEDLQVDQELVLEKIKTEHPKLTLLCSPNNPTGAELSLDFLETVLDLSPNLVLWDEAYAEFTDQSALELLPKYENLIISRTFSKAFSIAGLRFGYFIAHPHIAAQLLKVNLPYNINLFTESVALTLLGNKSVLMEQVQYIRRQRDRLYKILCAMENIEVFPTAANFVLFRVHDGKQVFNALKERGVLVRDVSGYPLLQNCLRVNAGTEAENNLFIDALKEVS